jgi:hypothetical protein
VDDGIPRQRLDPADARLWRVDRPPMSTLDPNLTVATGGYWSASILARVPPCKRSIDTNYWRIRLVTGFRR